MTTKQRRAGWNRETGASTKDVSVQAPIGEPPRSQTLLQAVVDLFPGQMIVVDHDRHIILANRAAHPVTGPDAAVDSPIAPTTARNDALFCGAIEVTDTVEDAIRTRKVTTVTRSHRDSHGNETATEVTATPVLDANGDVAQIVVWSRPPADEHAVRLKHQLRQAQKTEALGQFAGNIIHDFNNILTAILGNVELMQAELESELPPDDILVTGLTQIDRAGRRAATLAQQWLSLRHREIADPHPTDPNELIRDTEQMLRSLLSTRFDLQLSLAPRLHPVDADAVQIEQIVMNLVFNARDAMAAGGTLTVATANVTLDEHSIATTPAAVPGPHVMIAVSGASEKPRARTVKPLFTSEQRPSPELSTVYNIVRKVNGYVTIDSDAERGTTYRVYLPASSTTVAQP